MGIRLEAELGVLKAGKVKVVESHRRLRREQRYGFLHALWWIWLEDGWSAASVPPGAGDAVRAFLEDVKDPEQLFDADLEKRLQIPVNEALDRGGFKRTDRTLRDVMFACSASLLRRYHFGDCRPL